MPAGNVLRVELDNDEAVKCDQHGHRGLIK